MRLSPTENNTGHNLENTLHLFNLSVHISRMRLFGLNRAQKPELKRSMWK